MIAKKTIALRIIAGIQSGEHHWGLFSDDPRLVRDKSHESVLFYQDRVNILVRKMACDYIAGLLDA